MTYSDVRNKICIGTITNGGSKGRFKRTIIDDVSHGLLAHFIYGVYRGRGGGS